MGTNFSKYLFFPLDKFAFEEGELLHFDRENRVKMEDEETQTLEQKFEYFQSDLHPDIEYIPNIVYILPTDTIVLLEKVMMKSKVNTGWRNECVVTKFLHVPSLRIFFRVHETRTQAESCLVRC